jgi:hypothetical protein
VELDGRPLLVSFATCGGAALYFSLSFEPDFAVVLGAAGSFFALWVAARRWWTSDVAIAAVLVCFGLSLGAVAAGAGARLVAAPVMLAEAGPANRSDRTTGTACRPSRQAELDLERYQ